MRGYWLTAVLGLLASGATSAPGTGPAVIKTTLAGRPHVTYAYSVVDPRKVAVSVKAFPQEMPIPSIPDQIVCKGVGMTGGFSRRSREGLKPLGLARTADATVSALAAWTDGGVLWIKGPKAAISRISAWRSAPESDGMALQAKPLLVVDGKLDEPLNDQRRMNRVAVGTMKDGSLVLIGAFTSHDNAVTLRDFARDAIAILGPNLISLLNMDGGPSAFMFSNGARMLPSQGAVTTYLCAEPR